MAAPSQFAILLILGAALLHALWNAVVKGSGDRAITIGLIAIGNALFGIGLALFVEPPGPESYIYILLTIAVHFFYFIFLIAAYRLGDFSLVYPIARGVAPLLVACGGMVFAGEYLSHFAWSGIVLICAAISILVLARGEIPSDPKAFVAALLTGCCIATYTIVDGLGVRASGSPLGYIGWSFGLQIVFGVGFLLYRRKHLSKLPRSAYAAGIGGGLISGLAYALAIYAMSLTTLGAVSAIRESSVIIAALIGAIWFGERPWKPRLFSAGVVAIGVYLLAH